MMFFKKYLFIQQFIILIVFYIKEAIFPTFYFSNSEGLFLNKILPKMHLSRRFLDSSSSKLSKLTFIYFTRQVECMISKLLFILYREMKPLDIQQPSNDQFTTIEVKKYTRKQIIAFILSIIIAFTIGVLITFNIVSNRYQIQSKRLIRQIDVKRKNQKIAKQKNINNTAISFPKQYLFQDPKLKDILKEFYLGRDVKSVADFGCGKCTYIIGLHRQTQIKVEGYEYSLLTDVDFVYQKDLSQPVELGKTYDYIQSFGVGEHIYQQFQANFLLNIAKHASKGIILTWAVMGSEGYLHVNNRDNNYVIRKVQALGFKFNKQQTKAMRNKIDPLFKDNLMLFDRKNKTL